MNDRELNKRHIYNIFIPCSLRLQSMEAVYIPWPQIIISVEADYDLENRICKKYIFVTNAKCFYSISFMDMAFQECTFSFLSVVSR